MGYRRPIGASWAWLARARSVLVVAVVSLFCVSFFVFVFSFELGPRDSHWNPNTQWALKCDTRNHRQELVDEDELEI